MRIDESVGEFGLIDMLADMIPIADKSVITGIGDDCAVVENGTMEMLVTTDMMIEDVHFSRKWNTPYQIGRKLIESNVSDIVSMGGIPMYATASICITPDTEVEFMKSFYEGMRDGIHHYSMSLIGGDTTQGKEITLSLSIIGNVEKGKACLRSGANEGDLLCVTGELGASAAGLAYLKSGTEPHKAYQHLNPHSREIMEGRSISAHATSMIDVSDGLSSEVRHICKRSGVGARIDAKKIPISPVAMDASRTFGTDPLDYALNGGEDFELVFTISPHNLKKLSDDFFDFTVIGEILLPEDGISLQIGNKTMPLGHGYVHFSKET